MIMKCKITKNEFFVEFFLKSFKPLKKLLSSMLLSRVGRKSETDKFFFRPCDTHLVACTVISLPSALIL